jgi:hypothetical protein
MSSMFTWVDFAEDDRRKMADVIALFAEKDTRDELGLGGVRDTFADLLFPAHFVMEPTAPETQNPPRRAGLVRQSNPVGGGKSVCDNPIFPQNPSRCKPFFGDGGALSYFAFPGTRDCVFGRALPGAVEATDCPGHGPCSPRSRASRRPAPRRGLQAPMVAADTAKASIYKASFEGH